MRWLSRTKQNTKPTEKDSLVSRMSSSEPFKDLTRCGCNCGQVLNAETPLEEVEQRVFILGHVPDEWREYARIRQSERDAQREVAIQQAQAAANLKAYTEIRARIDRITANKAVLISCGVIVVDLLTAAAGELSKAERLLGNDQREAFGLSAWHEPATQVIESAKPSGLHRPEYVGF